MSLERRRIEYAGNGMVSGLGPFCTSVSSVTGSFAASGLAQPDTVFIHDREPAIDPLENIELEQPPRGLL